MSDLVERLRNRTHDAPMPSERLMDEAADALERLSKLFIAASSTIDLLESNARVQAELLADTCRERDELRRQLTSARAALVPFASVVEVSPLGDGRIDRVMIEVSINDLRAAKKEGVGAFRVNG